MNLKSDIEHYGNEILELLGTTDFAAKLSTITAEKENDFTLPNFIARKYGWAAMEAELPAVYVMGLSDELIEDRGLNRWVWFKYSIEVYATSDDTVRLEKMTNRYARAIDETLLSNYRDMGLRTKIDYSPVMKYEDALFKVCSLQFQLKVFQDIT